MALTQFQQIIGYQFKKTSLLQQALTHKSFGSPHYERLEFLGDSLLNAWVSIWLMRLYPHLSEGQLSTMRASIVSRKTLAVVGKEWTVLTHIRQSLPKSHLDKASVSIMADCVESVAAAVFLDSGWDACGTFLWPWLSSMCQDANHSELHSKTALQQWCQKRQLALPSYTSEPLAGGFLVFCRIDGIEHVTEAKASNKRDGELQAAKDMLQWLEKQDD